MDIKMDSKHHDPQYTELEKELISKAKERVIYSDIAQPIRVETSYSGDTGKLGSVSLSLSKSGGMGLSLPGLSATTYNTKSINFSVSAETPLTQEVVNTMFKELEGFLGLFPS
jgi:hypothetical protein